MRDLDLALKIRLDGAEQVRRRLGEVEQSSERLRSGLARMGQALAGAFAASTISRSFLDVAQSAERMRASLTAITGSSAAAGTELDYIREVADRLGVGLDDAAAAYISLSAAAKNTALEGQASRDIFEAVGLAMAKLGKTGADTRGALLAIEQMISKGTVSAEELRGQLGERLPGAFQAASRAMGVTTEELGKLLQKGGVTAEQLLPKLAAELNRLYDDGARVQTLGAEWARLGNRFAEVADRINQAGDVTGRLGEGLSLVAANAETVVDVGIVGAMAALGVGFGKATTGAVALSKGLIDQAAAARLAATQAAATAAANEGEAAAATLTTRAYLAQLATTRDVLANKAAYLAATVAQTEAEIARMSGIARLAAVERTLIPQRQALTAATAAAAKAEAALAAATTAATRGAGLLRGALALLGGPIGAITTALTLGATAWLIWGRDADSALSKVKRGAEAAREQFEALKLQQAADAKGGGQEGAIKAQLDVIQAKRLKILADIQKEDRSTREGREEIAQLREKLRLLMEERNSLQATLTLLERRGALNEQQATATALPDPTGPLKGVSPELAENVRAAIAAAAKEGIELGISSGLRSTERQAELYAAELRKTGSAELARKNVAPPGTSRHEKGEAVDLSGDAAARDWLARNAGRFGLETYRGPGYKNHLHVQLRDLEREQKALADATKEAEEAQREQSEAAKAAEEILSAHREELAQQAEAWKDTIDPMREHIRALDELTSLYRAGAIDRPTYQAGQGIIAGRMKDTAEGMVPPAEEGFNALREMAVEAAQQIHQAFADFLYRPWEDGLRGMLESFADMLHKMAAQILAQQAIMAFARAMGGTAGGTDIWSLVLGSATKMFHGGGLVGRDDRTYPPRQALAPDEVPAILQTGEQVLSRREVAAGYGRSPGEVVAGYLGRIGITHTAPGPGFVPSVPPTPSLAALPAQLLRGLPRYHDGGLVTGYAPAAQRTPEGSGAASPTTVRIVNVQDPEVAADWIGSAAGERQILNVLRRNRAAIRREVIG